MYRLQQEVGRIVMADPAVDTVAMGLGSGVGAAVQNNGRMFIQLKPFDERDVDIFGVIRRLRPKLAQIAGARVYLFAAQDVTVGARFARRSSSTLCRTRALTSSTLGRSRPEASVPAPVARRCDRPAEFRHNANAEDRARHGLALWRQPQLIDDTLYDAFGQRQVTQYFTQVNTYHVMRR